MRTILLTTLTGLLATAPLVRCNFAQGAESSGRSEEASGIQPSNSVETSGRPKVVCFGDSITKRGYTTIMAELLDVETVMAGVAGNSTAQALRRMSADVLAHEPDVVVIFFGTNDLRVDAPNVHVPVDEYGRNLETMIKACTQIGAHVVLCTLPPINPEAFFRRHDKVVYDAAGGLPHLIAAYRQAALNVAAQQDVPVVDLNQLLRQTPEWMHRDGVHPSPAGNALIARHIARAVKPLLKPASANADQQEPQ